MVEANGEELFETFFEIGLQVGVNYYKYDIVVFLSVLPKEAGDLFCKFCYTANEL